MEWQLNPLLYLALFLVLLVVLLLLLCLLLRQLRGLEGSIPGAPPRSSSLELRPGTWER